MPVDDHPHDNPPKWTLRVMMMHAAHDPNLGKSSYCTNNLKQQKLVRPLVTLDSAAVVNWSVSYSGHTASLSSVSLFANEHQ